MHRPTLGSTIHSFTAKANAHRTSVERFADWMTTKFGSVRFLAWNIMVFLVWIVMNAGLIPGIPIFDPYPFGFLTVVVSLEAIVLSVIVLISQNRAETIAEIREEIDLQINIITEREITKVLHLVKMIAERQEINLKQDLELELMLQEVNIDKISQTLEKQLGLESLHLGNKKHSNPAKLRQSPR